MINSDNWNLDILYSPQHLNNQSSLHSTTSHSQQASRYNYSNNPTTSNAANFHHFGSNSASSGGTYADNMPPNFGGPQRYTRGVGSAGPQQIISDPEYISGCNCLQCRQLIQGTGCCSTIVMHCSKFLLYFNTNIWTV